ncbi:hypothetical protein [Streptomyces sp. CB03578]|uniref:hypothetical protein n=1 Tax=Streptomyces sp. CB03578 TaxID=1718987 RepID=UPI000B07C0E8|nr:hypothetical protein [Streptomyces sp. CB03578]
MKEFVINKGYGDERPISATSYSTVGDFIDFFGPYTDGESPVVLRVRADRVYTIELITG